MPLNDLAKADPSGISALFLGAADLESQSAADNQYGNLKGHIAIYFAYWIFVLS
jgi:hypothetical protein